MTFAGGQSQSILAWIIALFMAFAGATGQSAQNEATPAASPVAPAAANCAGTEPSGLIVYQTLISPTTQVVVVDPGTGEELHRIELPGASRVWPTARPGTALVTDDQDRVHLLDAEAGTVTELALPGENDAYIPNSGVALSSAQGSRYMLLTTARRDQVALVDLETGQTTDLMALTGEEFALYGMISPDDRYAVFTFGEHAYLIPTADPTALRRLGEGSRGGGALIAPDGSRIVYHQKVGDVRFELMVEHPDGSDSQVVATSHRPLDAQFAGTSDRLLVRTIDALLLIDLATGDKLQLLEEWVITWLVAPDGGSVLVHSGEEVRGESTSGENWVVIDLESGELAALDGLERHRPIAQFSGARWVVMAGETFFGGREGEEDDVIYGVDLVTGEVRELFTAQEDEQYQPPWPASPDGRFALLLVGLAEGGSRLWLLDVASGSSRVVGAGGGAISPDGCWITVQTIVGTGEGRTISIGMQPIAGGEARPIADNGYQAVWVAS